jgi:hypothetical protein
VTARQATACAIAEARKYKRIPMTQRFRYLKRGRLALVFGASMTVATCSIELGNPGRIRLWPAGCLRFGTGP